MGQDQLVPDLVQPAIRHQRLDHLPLAFTQGPVVELSCTSALGFAGAGDLQEYQPIGDQLLPTLAVPAADMQAVLQPEYHRRLSSQIVVVDQHGPLAEYLAVASTHQ